MSKYNYEVENMGSDKNYLEGKIYKTLNSLIKDLKVGTKTAEISIFIPGKNGRQSIGAGYRTINNVTEKGYSITGIYYEC